MHGSRPFLIVTFIFCILSFAACNGNDAANNGNQVNTVSRGEQPSPSDQAKDNIEELGSIINLSFEPEDVAWQDNAANSTNGNVRKLVAVLRYSPENTKRVVAAAVKTGQGTPGTRGTETWYPAELVSQGEIGGDDSVNVVTYSAGEFLRPPFTEGKLSAVENSDYFILELQTGKSAP